MKEPSLLDFMPPEHTQIVIQGDCLEEMRKMEANSIDFIVTDPPYGLHFMGKSWDHGIPSVEYWQEMLRICKPGSMLAAFGGTRTYHRLACAIEDAGWEIRDCVAWLYGSGFPKSHNHFGLDGYGTALKPAYEPILLAMKPLEGNYKQNVEKWGIGGINIDQSRIASNLISHERKAGSEFGQNTGWNEHKNINSFYDASIGLWPANLILDEEAAQLLDQQSGYSKSSNHAIKHSVINDYFKGIKDAQTFGHNDSGGASRFFYCAKASSRERNAGLEGMPLKECDDWPQDLDPNCKRKANPRQNNHPTVKPIALMKYIIKMLAPPNNPILLDPFCGSGSTLIAAKELGINAIGIEKEAEYCEIARKRIEHG